MSQKRPLGITILSILNAVTILVIITGTIFYIAYYEEFSRQVTFSLREWVTWGSFQGIGGLIVAYGLWRGRKWGWWVTNYYFAYRGVRLIYDLAAGVGIALRPGIIPPGISMYNVRVSSGILFSLLWIVYLFKDNVLDYFGLAAYPRKRAIQLILAVGIGINALLRLVSRFF